MIRNDPDRYDRAIADAEVLRAIALGTRAKRAFIRNTEPITPLIRNEMSVLAGVMGANRDRAVCALVNKACNTHAAVRLLTDAGHGDDAMALARVLLENSVILRWLLLDPIYRLDLYCISDTLFVRRWRELIEKHFQHKPYLVAQAREIVDQQTLAVADFFGKTVHKWAQVLHPDGQTHHVNFESMMAEVASAGGAASSFEHDVIYFLHSAFVHSTAHSMRSFTHLRRAEHVTFDLGPNKQHCDEALRGANLFLFQVLQAASLYFGFRDIEDELDGWFERVSTAVPADPASGTKSDHVTE